MVTETEVQPSTESEQPLIPDYLADPDAVLKDMNVKWRYGRAPDYSKTRAVFANSMLLNVFLTGPLSFQRKHVSLRSCLAWSCIG